jgi:hypothetical protein
MMAAGGRGFPTLTPQGFLQMVGPFDQGVGVLKVLDFLPAIRKRNNKLVIVTVGFTADFIEQP